MKKIFTLFLSILFVVGCNESKSTKTDTNAELSTDKLTITYVTSPLNVPSIVEKNKEFVKTEMPGLDINYAEITSGAEQTLALASNDVQILHAVGGSSIIVAAAGGADIKVINMYSRAPEAFAMYSKDNNLNSAEDLKGYIEAIFAVCTSQKYYEEHKDIVDKFIETQKNIRDFMKNNAEETKKLLWKN